MTDRLGNPMPPPKPYKPIRPEYRVDSEGITNGCAWCDYVDCPEGTGFGLVTDAGQLIWICGDCEYLRDTQYKDN